MFYTLLEALKKRPFSALVDNGEIQISDKIIVLNLDRKCEISKGSLRISGIGTLNIDSDLFDLVSNKLNELDCLIFEYRHSKGGMPFKYYDFIHFGCTISKDGAITLC